MEGNNAETAAGYGFGHFVGYALQGDGAVIERQTVEAWAEFRGEPLQLVERPFLVEGERVALQRRRRAEDAGTATSAFLVVPRVRRGIGPEKEFRTAGNRSPAQRRTSIAQRA